MNHVHLSIDDKVALEVGKGHGIPVILKINSKKMFEHGIKFYCLLNSKISFAKVVFFTNKTFMNG